MCVLFYLCVFIIVQLIANCLVVIIKQHLPISIYKHILYIDSIYKHGVIITGYGHLSMYLYLCTTTHPGPY